MMKKYDVEYRQKMETTLMQGIWMHRCPVCWNRHASNNGFIAESIEWVHADDCPRAPEVVYDVDLIACAYTWTCPKCDEWNEERSQKSVVKCLSCDAEFPVAEYFHPRELETI
jgi:ribosomal protein L37AE/L43A